MEKRASKAHKPDPIQLNVLGCLLEAGGRLSRSQLTMGPLRHVEQNRRQRMLRAMVKQGWIDEIPVKRPMGAPAVHFQVTAAGQAHHAQHLPVPVQH